MIILHDNFCVACLQCYLGSHRWICCWKIKFGSEICQRAVSWVSRKHNWRWVAWNFSLCEMGWQKFSTDLYFVCIFSGIFNTNSVSGWHHSQVWDLGHSRSRKVSQLSSNVLQGSTGSNCCLWHHKPRHFWSGKNMGERASETGQP